MITYVMIEYDSHHGQVMIRNLESECDKDAGGEASRRGSRSTDCIYAVLRIEDDGTLTDIECGKSCPKGEEFPIFLE